MKSWSLTVNGSVSSTVRGRHLVAVHYAFRNFEFTTLLLVCFGSVVLDDLPEHLSISACDVGSQFSIHPLGVDK